jgi:hypothetical protein
MRNGSKFGAVSRLWIRCLSLALTVAVLITPRHAFAHDLTIDRLSLRLETRRLAGDLILDPELTRAAGTGKARELGLLELVREELRIEIDGRPRPVSLRVKELYSGDGAVPGDLVALRVPLEARPEQVRIFVGARLKALVLSVQVREESSSSLRSVLVEGGNFSPPYSFSDAEVSRAWKEGGPEQFEPATPPPSEPAPPKLEPKAVSSAGAVSRSAPRPEGFASEGFGSSFVRYLKLGFEHILPGGLDHVLFVICLVLGCRTFRPLLLQLTSFTLAHTLTLGLGTLGFVRLPGHVVEPLIALSIGFVAIENLVRRGHASHRLLVVFAFGLLHGLGFAGALSEVGLSGESLVASLLAFNVGVELGQLTVVAALLVLLGLFASRERTLALVLGPTSVAIAGVAGYWTVERLLG